LREARTCARSKLNEYAVSECTGPNRRAVMDVLRSRIAKQQAMDKIMSDYDRGREMLMQVLTDKRGEFANKEGKVTK
jgi:hypothetical protein